MTRFRVWLHQKLTRHMIYGSRHPLMPVAGEADLTVFQCPCGKWWARMDRYTRDAKGGDQ